MKKSNRTSSTHDMKISTLRSGHSYLQYYIDRNGKKRPHGKVVLAKPSGERLLEGEFHQGLPHGTWTSRYASGDRRSRSRYVLGKLHGETKQWHKSGRISHRIAFRKGQPHGKFEAFADDKRESLVQYTRYVGGRAVDRSVSRTRDGREYVINRSNSLAQLMVDGNSVSSIAERIGYLRANGDIAAVDIDRVVDFLSEMLSPAEVAAYLEMLDQLYETMGFDPGNKLLLKCASGFSALPVDPSAQSSPDMVTPDEQVQFESACQVQANDALGIDPNGVSDSQWQDFVDQRTSHMDSIFATCVDRTNPLIVSSDGGVVDVIKAIIEIVQDAFAYAAEQVGAIADDIASEFSRAADQAGRIADDIASDINDGAEGAIAKIEEKVKQALDYAEAAWEHPDRAIAAAALIVGFYALKWSWAAVAETPDFGEEGFWEYEQGMNRLSDEVWLRAKNILLHGPDHVADGPGTGGPADPNGGAEDMEPGAAGSCADLQAWWSRVKAYCETADWKTIECQQFLGASADCLERIQPGPEGDPVCFGMTGTGSGADIQREIRRRICEMTANGRFVADGTGNEVCQQPELAQPVLYDPCQDPAALWLPDQCLDSILTELVAAESVLPPIGDGLSSVEADSVAELHAETSRHDVPVAVAFTSSTCAPCHRLADMLADMQDDYAGQLDFKRVDIHRHPRLTGSLGIVHTPTLVVFDGDRMIGQRRVGAAGHEHLARYFDRALRKRGASEATKR